MVYTYKFKNNKKNPVTASDIEIKSTPNYTSKTDSDTDSINNIISSKNNYVKTNESSKTAPTAEDLKKSMIDGLHHCKTRVVYLHQLTHILR